MEDNIDTICMMLIKEAIDIIAKYDLLSIPVIDEDNKLIGTVNSIDLIDEVLYLCGKKDEIEILTSSLYLRDGFFDIFC